MPKRVDKIKLIYPSSCSCASVAFFRRRVGTGAVAESCSAGAVSCCCCYFFRFLFQLSVFPSPPARRRRRCCSPHPTKLYHYPAWPACYRAFPGFLPPAIRPRQRLLFLSFSHSCDCALEARPPSKLKPSAAHVAAPLIHLPQAHACCTTGAIETGRLNHVAAHLPAARPHPAVVCPVAQLSTPGREFPRARGHRRYVSAPVLRGPSLVGEACAGAQPANQHHLNFKLC